MTPPFQKLTLTLQGLTLKGGRFSFVCENIPGPKTHAELGEYVGRALQAEYDRIRGVEDTAALKERVRVLAKELEEATKPKRRGRPPKEKLITLAPEGGEA